MSGSYPDVPKLRIAWDVAVPWWPDEDEDLTLDQQHTEADA